MPVTEVGCMGVKPNLNIMDETTQEGQVLPRAWKAVTTAPGGPHQVYWSLEVDDPSKLWAFFDWESLADHEKFAKSFGGEAAKELPTILTHGEFTKHLDLTPSPYLALQSPVAEVFFAYFSSDISPAGKENAAAKLKQFVERGLSTCPEAIGVSCGWGVENDFPVRGGEEGQKGAALAMLIGWPNVNAHKKFLETEAFKGNAHLIESMEGVLKLTAFYISCQSLGRKTE